VSLRSRRTPPPQTAQLWPAPAKAMLNRATRDGQTGYLVIPSVGRPRLLMPVAVPGAVRMLTRHGGSRAELAVRGVWRVLQRSGAAGRLPITRLSVTPEADGIEAYLASSLSRPVRIGVLLGPPRANAKPVLQIFDDESGDTVAFAKLGSNPLAASLVDNEAVALALLSRAATRTFRAPKLLHHGRWRDMPVLVQEALPLSQSNRAPVDAPVGVMAEIAALSGIRDERLGGSEFLSRVTPSPHSSWHGIDMRALQRLHACLATVGECAVGSCHGDFGPWNMGTDGTRFEVWDWERYEAGVPVGFDAAHYRTQVAVAAAVEPSQAWPRILRDVSNLLRTLDRDGNRAAAAAGCYLLAICSRYRRDAAAGPTPRMRRRMVWLSAIASIAVVSLEEAYA
jgi:hypothetical protein